MTSTHEDNRQRALDAYGLLDVSGTEAFEALVRVAASICGAPIAAVTLLDRERQVFLASVGVPGLRELPRDIAFCDHTIRQATLLQVPDTSKDQRFDANPFVVGEPHVRFYAGMPLVNEDGYALGALCVLDQVPRRLTDTQEKALADLSLAVVALLETRRLSNERSAALSEGHRLTLALEEALRRSERRNEQLHFAEDVGEIGHWRVEPGKDTVYWSPQVYRIYGLDPATFRPTVETAIDNYHPDDRGMVAEAIRSAVEQRSPFDFVLRLIRTDGAIRRVHAKGRCEVDPQTNQTLGIFGVFQDITDREALRERVERQGRLVTAGTLAAGVGHEINNPLTYVTANLDIALSEVRAAETTAPSRRGQVLNEVLTEARDGADRIRHIVRALRAFAREDLAMLPTNVHSALEVSLRMAQHELRHAALVKTDLRPVCLVLADESRLAQVFVNLLVNAAQSFPTPDPTKNRITVTTSAEPYNRVAVTFADNGAGIPGDVFERMFDPFFTTKPVGVGTGLGLSISQNIVSSLGGEITCTTAVGKGTTFRVILPSAQRSTSEPPVHPAPLLVEGDERVA